MPDIPGGFDGADTPRITVVRAPACHQCDSALRTLGWLRNVMPMRVDVVEATSDDGARLVAEHRAPMSPLVLLDGEFVSSGKLRTGRLLDLLRAHGYTVPLEAIR